MKTIKLGKIETFNTRVDFETDMDKIKEHIEVNTDPIDQLFVEFFQFYGNRGKFLESQKRCNIKGEENLINETDAEYLFSIEDPFELDHNLGDRVKKNKRFEILS